MSRISDYMHLDGGVVRSIARLVCIYVAEPLTNLMNERTSHYK
jgi:hypothetical protein